MKKYTEEELDELVHTPGFQRIKRRELIEIEARGRLKEREEFRRELAPELLKLMISRPGDMSGLKDFAAAAVALSKDLLESLDQQRDLELDELGEGPA